MGKKGWINDLLSDEVRHLRAWMGYLTLTRQDLADATSIGLTRLNLILTSRREMRDLEKEEIYMEFEKRRKMAALPALQIRGEGDYDLRIDCRTISEDSFLLDAGGVYQVLNKKQLKSLARKMGSVSRNSSSRTPPRRPPRR